MYGFCIDMPADGPKVETRSLHVKANSWIARSLCCVGLNKCGLFSNEHNGMAAMEINKIRFFARPQSDPYSIPRAVSDGQTSREDH
jgi:hypothetical protein